MASIVTRIFKKSLDWIEAVGNKLPHPATLFALLAVLVVIASWLAEMFSLQATHPADHSVITVNNLLSPTGLRWIYTHVVLNFVTFPPLGYALTAMIGIGIAEGSGLFSAMIKALVLHAPTRLITASIVFAGVLSSVGGGAGYVILIPLGAMIYHAIGRHPMAGLAAAFCGVSGGFGANLTVGANDAILAGLSETAAQIIDNTATVNPTVNYYFMFVSTFVITAVGTWITEKIIEPRLGEYTGSAKRAFVEQLTSREKKGLIGALIGLLGVIALLAFAVIPDGAILRNPESNGVLDSPFFGGIIVGILIFFMVPGLIYGLIVGTIRNDRDFMKHITESMKPFLNYIVLVFFAAQFVYFFKYSRLGIILAIHGAEFLRNIGLTGIPLIIAFVFLSAFINLFMGSASAKWAIMAPVFVPMFMLLGYHPALTQVAFRIGDSTTNLITPMMSYFALIVTFSQKYDEKYGIGTIIATMIPYTIFFLIFWIILLCIWMCTGLPLGPGGPLYL
ncbi:MAG: AbgT family transporter [Phycisphaerae bacterium]|nr:AbgT family transporter [Phycisphaerae bacterium]NIP51350.1 AbgT family transporter [Phycisphaerae bacterium]NIS50544.1 AbgT family transporter [Phycisphaerae bacterium]NIU08279.1 AbgT family transporter [Phycisphaerae bacterium]NIU55775.1 AbgT family transporter [Phycisphaerae bacterium]